MGYRRANNLSTFFPDRYKNGDDYDNRGSRESSYPGHRKDTYVPSHKDIFVPNGGRPRPEGSGRAYPPIRQSKRDESFNSYGPYRSDKYIPQASNTPPTRSPSLSNGHKSTHTSSSPKHTPEYSSKQPLIQWKTFEETRYIDQNHLLTPMGDYQTSELTISQLHKPAYKVVFDPELSKDPTKGKQAILQKSDKQRKSKDPRLEPSFKAFLREVKRYKKVPFKAMTLPKLIYDKHSIGGPPSNEIVISGLSRVLNDAYLMNEIKRYGEVLESENIIDPSTGTPLGILRIKYGGTPDKAYRSAKSAVAELNGTRLEGNILQVGVNKEGKLLETLRNKIIQERSVKVKKAEILDKMNNIPSAPKAVLKKISMREEKRDKPSLPSVAAKPAPQIKDTATIKKESEDKLESHVVPAELEKYVKGRPFIFIASKYVKGQVEKNDIKKALETYDWTRVLYDASGVYVVFNSPRETQRCYQFENGKKVLSVNLYMEIHLPDDVKLEDVDEKYVNTQRDVIEEATSLLAKELESAIQKDIRTKIIAPAVLNFLNIDNFPELKAKLAPPIAPKKEAEEPSKKLTSKADTIMEDSSIDVFSLHRRLPKIPSVKKKDSSVSLSGSKKKLSSKNKRALPMSYRLNFEDDSESDFRESTVSTPQLESYYKDGDEENEQPPAKKQKTNKKPKEHLPLLYSSSSEEDDDEELEEDDSSGKTKESQPTTPETLQADKMDVDVDEKPEGKVDEEKGKDEKDVQPEVDETEVDYSSVEKRFRPTATAIPVPVHDEDNSLPLTIDNIQDIIKDDEDLELLKEVLESGSPTSPSKYPEYTFWKLKSIDHYKTVPISSNDSPDFLINKSGSHRSEGYVKISDELKVEYLPHKKRVHDPLNTVQVDNEENESSKVQSSRVNRANNRRFAYEVSTFNNQNEILTLNQLNKRKKPVSFARSAIHNWGLYALEPIANREMIIEYVGERIRQQVADFREKAYLKSGIGSSYLFRIDENTVIDATKKGGIARFINHCCQPSCTAKIIKVEGQKRIVIYALRDIGANEELTYDYKFERETNDNERVRCLCGAPGCKGYLN